MIVLRLNINTTERTRGIVSNIFAFDETLLITEKPRIAGFILKNTDDLW